MLIDWFTVVAEAVNFLILVALLERFLYGPLLKAIDSREQRIAASLAEAETKKQDAEKLDAQARKQIEDLDAVRDQAIAHAREEADRERQQMVQAARDSVRALEAGWQEDLRREKSVFLIDLRRAAANEILSIARHALSDLANADLERAAIRVFLQRLHSVDLTAENLTVVTSFELSPELCAEIMQAIETRAAKRPEVAFERSPNLAWGIELRADGQRIGWTPDAYLDALEDKLRAVIEEHTEVGSPLATV